ncbi:MAG: hypothetical protein QM780_17930 [Hyphomicrobium sp.]|uniref:hypothetical protein n=1 Tax=Hyphomicrobium sp. TaxID=82 RepID=UPI0039E4027E
MTLVIVFIGAICDYYFGAIGAVLSTLVVLASLSKAKADTVFPSVLLIGICWGAGTLLADTAGTVVGVSLATALTLWLESGAKIFLPGTRRPQMSSRDSTGS